MDNSTACVLRPFLPPNAMFLLHVSVVINHTAPLYAIYRPSCRPPARPARLPFQRQRKILVESRPRYFQATGYVTTGSWSAKNSDARDAARYAPRTLRDAHQRGDSETPVGIGDSGGGTEAATLRVVRCSERRNGTQPAAAAKAAV